MHENISSSCATCGDVCGSCCGTSSVWRTNLGLLFLRLGLAAVFLFHGWQKLSSMDATLQFFASLGLPPILAWLVAAGEFLAGLAMLLGLWTMWAGYLIAVIMLVAMILVTFKSGFAGYEFNLMLLLSALAVAKLGPGAWTVLCCWKKKTPSPVSGV